MKLVAMVFASLLLANSAWAAQGELWETRLVVQSAQHGRMEMPPQKICQKPADLSSFRMEDVMPGQALQCGVADTTQIGNKVTWKMDCPDGTSEGSMTLVAPGLYRGEMRARTGGEDYKMEFEGRRIGGACELDSQD